MSVSGVGWVGWGRRRGRRGKGGEISADLITFDYWCLSSCLSGRSESSVSSAKFGVEMALASGAHEFPSVTAVN